MDSLLTRISLLPQFLQDYIAEYNAEHRPLMKNVLNELEHFYKEIPCDNCYYAFITRKKAVCGKILFRDYYCCSKWCYYEFEYELRKSYLRQRRNCVTNNSSCDSSLVKV